MPPNAPTDVVDSPAHTFELAFHYPYPFEAVNRIAAIQKCSKPVYESCEVTHATSDGVDIVTYRAAVPWWLLPEHFDWEDRIMIDSAARKRTETGKNLSLPETYNITEVSTWSADAAGTGTDYLKLSWHIRSTNAAHNDFLHTHANTDAALQQISGMVRSMSLQTREAELQLVREYVESNAAATASAVEVDVESSQTCSTQDVSGAYSSSSEAPIASVSGSTSIMVTDEVRELTIAS
eukprot:16164-Heterococcus_DN1.PRE.1